MIVNDCKKVEVIDVSCSEVYSVVERTASRNIGKYFPYCTVTSICIQVGFFIYNCEVNNLTNSECIMPDMGLEYFKGWMYGTLGCKGMNKKYELWRYVTYGVSHYGIVHLLSNCVLTFLMGSDIEIMHGGGRLLGISYVGNLLGVWIFVINEHIQQRNRVLVGSSVILYSLIGARVTNLLLNEDSMYKREFKVRVGIVSVVVINDLVQYFVLYNEMVSYSGHFGGFLGGLLGGSFFLRNYRETIFESYLQNVIRCCTIMVFVGCGTAAYVLPLRDC